MSGNTLDQTQNLINQLRDIHLPAPVANWPWATGRYLLIAVVAAAIAVLAGFMWRCYQQQQQQRELLKRFTALQQLGDFAGMSALLKQLAIYLYPHEAVAGLHNRAWLAFLDRTNIERPLERFQSPAGNLLLDLPYRKSAHAVTRAQQEKLFNLVQMWVIKNYRNASKVIRQRRKSSLLNPITGKR